MTAMHVPEIAAHADETLVAEAAALGSNSSNTRPTPASSCGSGDGALNQGRSS